MANEAKSIRKHYDIYAIIRTPQEVHFGHEKQININVVEVVKVAGRVGDDYQEKLYFSPTKRRGIERRSILWMPVGEKLYTDFHNCGIPKTCCNCLLCHVFGGLDNKEAKMSITARITHGGGIAVQSLPPEVKQRLRVNSALEKNITEREDEGEGSTIPFKKEYAEPNIWFPIYNHCISLLPEEFGLVAYSFLDAMGRYGAGHGKGGHIVSGLINGQQEPLIVVDEYLVPKASRPIVSPDINSTDEALADFTKSIPINDNTKWGNKGLISESEKGVDLFKRYYGKAAIEKLEKAATEFVLSFKNKKEG